MSTVSEHAYSFKGDSGMAHSKEFQVRVFDKVSTSLYGRIRISRGATSSLMISAEESALEAVHAVVNDGTLELRTKQSYFGSSSNGRSLASQLLDQILKRRTSEAGHRSMTNRAHYTIEVTTPRLRNLTIGGSARVAVESHLHDDDSIKLTCGGASAVTIEAVSAPRVDLVSAGTASLELNNMAGKSLDSRISGTASLRVSGEVEEVSARISGTGSLDAIGLQTKHATIVTSGASNASINAEEILDVKSSGACSVRYLGSPKRNTKFSGVLDCSPVNSEA